MKKKPGEELSVPTRRQASQVARMIGCSGAHQLDDGTWMPCSTHEQLSERIGKGETKSLKPRKRRKRKGNKPVDGYERLLERGVTGIETLEGGGLVSAQISAKAARKARRDRLAATPSLLRERIRGSQRNRAGSAASTSAGRGVAIDESTLASLKNKVKEHNQKVKDKESWRRASVGQLKAVYRRGAGAFSVSHRPGMTRGQWAMGRVNAFLLILSSGKPRNARYVGDNDLLPKGHPWKKTIGSKSVEVKRLRIGRLGGGGGGPLRRLRRGGRGPDPDAVDADGDGTVEDGTPFERPARARRAVQGARNLVSRVTLKPTARKRKRHEQLNMSGILGRVTNPDDGFTFRMNGMNDAKSGWAIARNGQGIAIPASAMYDKNGNVTDEGRRLFLAFVDRFGKDLFGENDKPGVTVHVGGWHNPDTGMIHFDVTDVYDKKDFSLEQAMRIGKKEKQISIADLDEIQKALQSGNWGAHQTTIKTGGDGGDVVDLEDFEPELAKLDKLYGPISRPSLQERVEQGPENVSMLLAQPIKELGDKHGVQKDWQGIVALSPDRRQEIADFYNAAEEITAEEASGEIKQAYKALTDEIDQQYEMLVKELGIEVEFVDYDPYPDFMEMRKDYVENKRMKIMKTSATGSHPLMTDEQNDKFRAVHDAFGHLATGRGFDRHGEEAAYQAHSTMFSPEAQKALASETRGQNNTLIVNGDFPPQKLVILPEDLMKSLFVMAIMMFKAMQDLSKKARIDSDRDNAYTATNSHHVSGGRVLRSADKVK